jgi:hypothetical protein
MLLVVIYSYLKSVLRHQFLVWDTIGPEPREQGCKDPWSFFEAISGPRERKRERERDREKMGETIIKHWIT